MKDRKYQITKAQLDKQLGKKALRRPIEQAMKMYYGESKLFSIIDEYFVPYEMVRTKDLVKMLQRMTFDWRSSDFGKIDLPTPKTQDRIAYLKIVEQFLRIDVTNEELKSIQHLFRNKEFMQNQSSFEQKLRKELSTREHIPTKKDGKIIRKLKSQGRYIID